MNGLARSSWTGIPSLLLCLLLGLSAEAQPSCTPRTVDAVSSPLRDWIRFYASYDAQIRADLAIGDPQPMGNDGRGVLPREPGLGGEGHALRVGGRAGIVQSVDYARTDNVKFNTTGSLSFWIRPIDWKRPGSGGGYLPFVRFRSLRGVFLVERDRRGPKQDRDRIIVGFFGKNGLPSYPLMLPLPEAWRNGEWHLIAVSWDATGFSVSLDGQTAVRRGTPGNALARALEDPSYALHWTVGYRKPEPTAIDELAIYRRELRESDVQWLWNAGCGPEPLSSGDSADQRSSTSTQRRSGS